MRLRIVAYDAANAGLTSSTGPVGGLMNRAADSFEMTHYSSFFKSTRKPFLLFKRVALAIFAVFCRKKNKIIEAKASPKKLIEKINRELHE